MNRWATKLACFDTETSGPDPEKDHIVTATWLLMGLDGETIEQRDWLIDIGEDIDPGAIAVHGITNEHMREHGRKDRGKALWEIATQLDIYDRNDIPVVIYNAPFDLTMLDREMRSENRFKNFRAPRVIIDPLVLDKGLDKFRPGGRKLVDVAPVYGVHIREDAHDAAADCVMAGQIALALLRDTTRPWINRPTVHPVTGKALQAPPPSILPQMTLQQIHNKQIPTKLDQTNGLRTYFIKKAKTDPALTPEERAEAIAKANAMSGAWPMIPFEEPTDA